MDVDGDPFLSDVEEDKAIEKTSKEPYQLVAIVHVVTAAKSCFQC